MSSEDRQGTEYAAFLVEQLTREFARRDSVNSRATSTLTSSTALVTIATGVFALLLGEDFKFSRVALTTITVALLAFLACAIFTVIAGLNRTYDAVDEKTMRALLSSEHWKDHEIDARWQSANFNILSITTLRAGTNFKSFFLSLAGFAQVLAISALAASTLIVLS